MLKRNGQDGSHPAWVIPREEAAYAAAWAAIRPEFTELTKLGQQMVEFGRHTADSPSTGTVMVSDGVEWRSQIRLLKLPASEVFLCRQNGAPHFAIIQRFEIESPYAKAHGNVEVLLRGDNASQLIQDYASEVRHTLRFMASNAVAKAQRVAWKQFPAHHPSEVVRAISERCAQVVGPREVIGRSNHHGQSLRV